MGHVNLLGTRWRYRLGGGKPSPNARNKAGQTERAYVDFTVDGVSLEETLGARQLDLIGILGWGDGNYQVVLIDQLLLRPGPTMAPARQLLYVCSECGDIGCGAITAEVSISGNEIVWSSFGFENNYDSSMSDFESYRTVGPFRFDRDQYGAAVRDAFVRRDV